MNNFTLKTFLTSNIEIEPKLLEEQIQSLEAIKVKKDDFILRKGEFCKHAFYVENGLLRYYFIDDKGKEYTIQFAPEKWFITDRDSMYFNQPTKYFIQALEDRDIILIEESFITELSLKSKSFIEFNNKLLHNHIRHLQNRITQLLSASAEERYLEFIKIYPDLLLRVPQWMIASYLGITPESLSRVRKDLAVRNFKQ